MLMAEVIEESLQRDSFQLMLTRCRCIPSYWTLTVWATGLWHFVWNRQVRTAMLKGLYFMDGATLLTPIYEIKILELTNDLSTYIFEEKIGTRVVTDEEQTRQLMAYSSNTKTRRFKNRISLWQQQTSRLMEVSAPRLEVSDLITPPTYHRFPPLSFSLKNIKLKTRISSLPVSLLLACLAARLTLTQILNWLICLEEQVLPSRSHFSGKFILWGRWGEYEMELCGTITDGFFISLLWSDYLLTSFITLQDRCLSWPYLFIDNVVTFYCENYTFYWKTSMFLMGTSSASGSSCCLSNGLINNRCSKAQSDQTYFCFGNNS